MSILSFIILTFSASFVNGVIYNVSTALNMELREAFPANAFQSSCVSSSCPNLNSPSVCSTAGSSYDLNATFSAIIDCATDNSICGIGIESRPILFIQISLDELLQGVPLSGVITSTPDCVYAKVIPTFVVIPGANEVVMSLPHLSLVGNMSCDIALNATSQSELPLTLPSVTVGFRYTFNYSSTIKINHDNSVTVDNPTFEVTGVNFDGLLFPPFPGIPDYLPTFKALVGSALGRMSLTIYVGGFYQNLIESALRVAADNCEH